MDRSELAYIGLGANVGEARVALVRGVAELGLLPGASLAGVSRLYLTRPVGPADQGDFHNAVVALRVASGSAPEIEASTLLLALKGIERAMGRVERERWGPREIDLDLLLYGNHVIRVERPLEARSEDPRRPGGQWLEVPHPAASTRAFVLAPLADLAPELEPPGWGTTVAGALERALAREGPDAVHPVGEWDGAIARWAAGAEARSDVSQASGD